LWVLHKPSLHGTVIQEQVAFYSLVP
jgi:hypothetical protein